MARSVDSQVQNNNLIHRRREDIVNAALRVFRNHGFHLATTRMIANEANITQSNLYNYVSAKGDILYLVCEHLVGLYEEGVEKAINRYSDPRERFLAVLRETLRIVLQHKDELVLLYNETHALEKGDRCQILKSVSRLNSSFQRVIRDYESECGPLAVSNRRIAANLMTFVPAIVALRWWDLSVHSESEEIEEQIFLFVLNGLGVKLTA
jgi:AcrR family transcriptional regulator